MNLFRLVGDILHLVSIILLILKIQKQRSCAGISLKTQELLCIVFYTRYLDLFTHYVSLYNSTMKIFFIISSTYTVYLMKGPYKTSYDATHDSMRSMFIIGPCFVIALLIHESFGFLEILWTFSIYLEALSILPQFFLLQKTGDIDNVTSHYVFALGAYRGCYLLNWIYRTMYDTRYQSHWLVWVSGLVQTALYCDFFYYYIKAKFYGQKLQLPQ